MLEFFENLNFCFYLKLCFCQTYDVTILFSNLLSDSKSIACFIKEPNSAITNELLSTHPILSSNNMHSKRSLWLFLQAWGLTILDCALNDSRIPSSKVTLLIAT